MALMNPLFWGLVTISTFVDANSLEHFFPHQLQRLFTFNLIFGNILFVIMGAYAVRKRKFWRLIPWAFHLPIYWLLQSVAAYKALWQLVFAPHFWEKTTHGLSSEIRGTKLGVLRSLRFQFPRRKFRERKEK